MIGITLGILYATFAVLHQAGFVEDLGVRNIAQIVIVGIITCVYSCQVRHRDCKWAYIIAYLFRLGLLFLSVYGRNICTVPFDGEDTEYFYSAAYLNHASYAADALVTLTTWVSYLLGDARLIYQYAMLMISMLGIRITDCVMHELGMNYRIRMICLSVAAIFPSFAVLGSLFNREAIVSTGTIASLWFFIKYLKMDGNVKKVMFLSSSLTISTVICLFHAAPAAIIMGYIIAILMFDYQDDRVSISFQSVSAAGILLVILWLIFTCNPNAFEKLRGITDVQSIARRFMFDSNLAAGSSYANYVGDSDTWGRFILFTPARMFYGMFAPLPWEWRNITDAVTFFANSLFYIVVSFVAIVDVFKRAYWRVFNKWYVLTLALASAMVGWGSIAYGTAIRHRDKFFLLFLILMAIELRGRDKETV